jgi:hypothetical protein
LLVRLKDKGPVILVGDAAHFHENYVANGVPSFNFDRADTVASIERIKQIENNPNATVIIQRDPRDIGKLPAFPAGAKQRPVAGPGGRALRAISVRLDSSFALTIRLKDGPWLKSDVR